MRVRPFQRYIERGPERPMVSISGTIPGPALVVETLNRRLEVDTLEVGEDERGRYAVVKEGTYTLDEHAQLEVEYDANLDEYVVGVRLVAKDPIGFWVHFDEDGHMNGSSSGQYGGPDSEHPSVN